MLVDGVGGVFVVVVVVVIVVVVKMSSLMFLSCRRRWCCYSFVALHKIALGLTIKRALFGSLT